MKCLYKHLIILAFFSMLFILACKKSNLPVTDPPTDQTGLPKVSTLPFSALTRYSVAVKGNVSDTAGMPVLDAGFVIDTLPSPTITKNLNKFTRTRALNGDLNLTIEDLKPLETLYLRAFAKNEKGVGYGDEIHFTVPDHKVFPADIMLSTQEEVESFGANHYTFIDGKLTITGSVTDLHPLKNLAVINYELDVVNTTSLVDLSGLDSLEVTNHAGYLHGMHFRFNAALRSFKGLQTLSANYGDFEILNNDVLSSLDGLNNIALNYFGELRVENCNQLKSLDGLEHLFYEDGNLMLRNNELLADLRGLKNLQHVSGLIDIETNPSLTSLDGLEKLHNLPSLQLQNNATLIDIKSLSAVDTMPILHIDGNPLLEDLTALNRLKNMEYLSIVNSENIKSLHAFSNVTSIGGLTIDNTGVTDLSGLEGITSINGAQLYNNAHLTSLMGLNNLESVGQLSLSRNDLLANLDGLEKLQSASYVSIDNNHALSGYCGLKNLFVKSPAVQLSDNYNLTNPTKEEIVANCP